MPKPSTGSNAADTHEHKRVVRPPRAVAIKQAPLSHERLYTVRSALGPGSSVWYTGAELTPSCENTEDTLRGIKGLSAHRAQFFGHCFRTRLTARVVHARREAVRDLIVHADDAETLVCNRRLLLHSGSRCTCCRFRCLHLSSFCRAKQLPLDIAPLTEEIRPLSPIVIFDLVFAGLCAELGNRAFVPTLVAFPPNPQPLPF